LQRGISGWVWFRTPTEMRGVYEQMRSQKGQRQTANQQLGLLQFDPKATTKL